MWAFVRASKVSRTGPRVNPESIPPTSKALEKRAWEREEKEKLARQLDIQRRRALGEQVASGSDRLHCNTLTIISIQS